MFNNTDLTINDLIARFVILLIALPVHECAHAVTAGWLGDPTARNLGRVTLNPFKHVDIFGAVLLITAGFGWAKPVPVYPGNFQRPRLGLAISSLAGPVSNLLMGFFGILILKIGYVFFSFSSAVLQILLSFVVINVSLAVFNLLPIPPLDGSKILALILPEKAYGFVLKNQLPFTIFIFVLLYFGILTVPIYFLRSEILFAFDGATSFLGRIFS